MTTASLAEARDFDFLHGRWRVQHRRLAQRLTGSSDWQEFAGTTCVTPILGGRGNVDENEIDLPGERYHACTLRLFDPVARQWSLHWVDARRGRLDPPLVGRFDGAIGTFFGNDELDGQPIRVRFRWQRDGTAPRWEQAFSRDGATWEANWIMRFERDGGAA